MKEHLCLKCKCDLSHRHISTKYCRECAIEIDKAKSAERRKK